MRLVFFGSGCFAVTSLQALLAAGHDVALVCTRPPRQAGRGRPNRPTQVESWAVSKGLEVCSPDDPGESGFLRKIRDSAPDAGVLADYARLLPQTALSLPRLGFLNIHPSLLPRWRGAAPIQRAIMAGDDVTGVCIMRMNEKLDEGPVLMRRKVLISPSDTCGSAARRLADEGAKLIVSSLDAIDRLKPLRLDQSAPSYAHKITKSEARINWDQPAEQVDRLIRGLSPFPGAWSSLRGQRIKLLDSRRADGSGEPGELLDSGIHVACGTGAVRILRLQRSGRRPMEPEEFLRGFRISHGEKFGA